MEAGVSIHARKKQSTICGYCREGLRQQYFTSCHDCHTPIHDACWQEFERCPTLGCGFKSYLLPERMSHCLDHPQPRLNEDNAGPILAGVMLALIGIAQIAQGSPVFQVAFMLGTFFLFLAWAGEWL